MGDLKLSVQVSQIASDEKLEDRDVLKKQIEQNDVINEFQRKQLLDELASGGPPEATQATFEESQKMANPEFQDGDEKRRRTLLTEPIPRFMV